MYRTKQIVLEDEAQMLRNKEILNILIYQMNTFQTILRFLLTPVRMVKINKVYHISCGGGADNVSPYLLHMGVQTPLANMKINLEDSQVSGTSFASRFSRCMTTLGYMNRELYILLEGQFLPMFVTTRNQKQH